VGQAATARRAIAKPVIPEAGPGEDRGGYKETGRRS
jgi:hypothetical protein